MATNSPVVPSIRPTSVTCGPGRHASDESITWNNGCVSIGASETDLDRGVLHRASARRRPPRPAAARGCPRSAARRARAPRRRASTATPAARRDDGVGGERHVVRVAAEHHEVVRVVRDRGGDRAGPVPPARRAAPRAASASMRPCRCTVTCTRSPSGTSTTPSRTIDRRSRPNGSSPRRRSRACGARRRARRAAAACRTARGRASFIVSSGGSLGPSTTSTSMRPPAATNRPSTSTCSATNVSRSVEHDDVGRRPAATSAEVDALQPVRGVVRRAPQREHRVHAVRDEPAEQVVDAAVVRAA